MKKTTLIGFAFVSCFGMVFLSSADKPVETKGVMEFDSQVVYSLKEPIPRSRLDRISARFDNLSGGVDKKQAAIILYRYNVEKGKNYLIAEAKKGDVESTVLLSLNEELDYKDIILKNIVTYSSRIKNGDDNIYIPWYMIIAISDWPGEDVNVALLKAYENNPEDSFLAIALARREVNDALPLIESSYRKVREEPNSADALLLGLCIVKLNGKDGKPLYERYSRHLLLEKSDPDVLSIITQGIFFTQDDQFISVMRELLQQAERILKEGQKIANTNAPTHNVAYLTYAVRFLRRASKTSDKSVFDSLVPLIASYLTDESLKKEFISDMLKDNKNPEMNDLMSTSFGRNLVDEQTKLSKLKVVPAYNLEIDKTLYDSIK